MRITVIGATGMVGSRVTAEALARGHEVVAVSRTPVPSATDYVTTVAADAADATDLRVTMAQADAVVLSLRTAPGDEAMLPTLTGSALDAAAAAAVRIVVIGGAGPLRRPGDRDGMLVDDPAFVPPRWRTLALASVAQLDVCRAHPHADWTYLSPPAVLEPGVRTGRYRRGTTTVLVGRSGVSRISAEDLALAVVDELEQRGTQEWFTVAQEDLR